jgi:NADH-quinone oxidoreductase subunit L
MTHAFFKALLFLGAGAVIHAMHHEQDMRNMGGLAGKIKYTYLLMWIGTLALTGVPPFAGFYSKDAILESAFAAHTPVGYVAWVLGILAAFMTTFYSFRLLFMTFHGQPKNQKALDHAHEAPITMQLPVTLLAIGAVVSGFMGFGMIGKGWFKEAIVLADGHDALAHAHHVPGWVKSAPLAMILMGFGLAVLMYLLKPHMPKALAERHPGKYAFLLNAWYFDRLYQKIFIEPAKTIGKGLWKTGDETIIDGYGVNGTAATVQRIANWIRQFQTGYVYHYAFAMLIGVLVLVTFYA